MPNTRKIKVQNPLVVDLRTWETGRLESVARLMLVEIGTRRRLTALELEDWVSDLLDGVVPFECYEDPQSREIRKRLSQAGRAYWLLSGRNRRSPFYTGAAL